MFSIFGCLFQSTLTTNTVNFASKKDTTNQENSNNREGEQPKLRNLFVKLVQVIPDIVLLKGNKLKGISNVIYKYNSKNSNLIWPLTDNTIVSSNPTTGEISAIKSRLVTIIPTSQLDTSNRHSGHITVKQADVPETLKRVGTKEATIKKIGKTIRLNTSIQMSDESLLSNVIWKSDKQSMVLSNDIASGISKVTTITAVVQGDYTKKDSVKITVCYKERNKYEKNIF